MGKGGGGGNGRSCKVFFNRSPTTNQKVPGSILSLVKGWTLAYCRWMGTLNVGVSLNVLLANLNNPHTCQYI